MNNFSLLFSMNEDSNKSIYLNKGTIIIKHKQLECNGRSIQRIISEINTALKQYGENVKKIVFAFNEIKFADKLTYIVLECLCYELIGRGIEIQLNACLNEKNIFRAGIRQSPLNYINNQNNIFVNRFKKTDISLNHYRRVIPGDTPRSSTIFCVIMAEVRSCLKVFAPDKYSKEVAEVVVELIGNAVEHTMADCLVDIDIVTNCRNRKEISSAVLCGINIVVLNCSTKLLGDALKDKMANRNFDPSAERYICLEQAYTKHGNNFCEEYDIDDFFNIAVFQNRISGRSYSEKVGGTGLPVMIKSIEKQAELYSCYVATGKKILWFKQEFLEYNDDDWIGFNDKRDFLLEPPSEKVIGRGTTFFPGTAYNLSFGIEQEDA